MNQELGKRLKVNNISSSCDADNLLACNWISQIFGLSEKDKSLFLCRFTPSSTYNDIRIFEIDILLLSVLEVSEFPLDLLLITKNRCGENQGDN